MNEEDSTEVRFPCIIPGWLRFVIFFFILAVAPTKYTNKPQSLGLANAGIRRFMN
jgi:hypothetical protein